MTNQTQSTPLSNEERDLFLAIVENDLGRFQTAYLHLESLGQPPEFKEWPVPSFPWCPTSTTFQVCLRWGSAAICEQNFRFCVLSEYDLLRTTPSAPLVQVAGVARCLTIALGNGADDEANFYTLLLERLVATLYEVVFKRHPAMLDPQALLAHLEAKDSWEALADVVLPYQRHYEKAWRAGQARSAPLHVNSLIGSSEGSFLAQ
jgi:hypothetical protein